MSRVLIDTDEWSYESDDAQVTTSTNSYGIEFTIQMYKGAYMSKPVEKNVSIKTPELYFENLTTLKVVMDKLDELVSIDGLFDIEIRVRVDDVDAWAVIGYGESGDPCVLRFEAQ